MVQNKMAKTSISLKKSKRTLYSSNQINSGKICWKFWYDLLKYIFITVKMIISSSGHDLFSWIYNNYKYFLSVETYDILMETQNMICFEKLM